jgi:lipopolysaccharide export system protein LptC
MALEFDGRLNEIELRDKIATTKSAINTCKNALVDALAFANTVTQAEMDRLGLTANQKAQAANFKTKVQAVYDAIVAQGF